MILHGVMDKMKNMKPCYSYYRMQEYEDMKINNVIFGEKKSNLCQEHTKIEWMVGNDAKHVQRRYKSDV